MKNNSFLIFIALMFVFSCSDKEDEEPMPVQDPLIGSWSLVAVVQDGQTLDVTEQPCLKDSHFVVQEEDMTLTLLAPQEIGSGSCQSETLSVPWINEDGVYYMVEEGEKEPAHLTLSNKNETLQVDINMESDPLSLMFVRQ